MCSLRALVHLISNDFALFKKFYCQLQLQSIVDMLSMLLFLKIIYQINMIMIFFLK